MSWRIVAVTSRAKLDYKMNYLVVRTADETKRININEISVLLIESTGVSLTTYLLSELIKSKICIILCDEKRLPQSTILPLYGSFDTSVKVRNQINWKTSSKESVWSEIVRAKIKGQSEVLKSVGELDKSHMLTKYAVEIEQNDRTNREGHAAKVYFNALFGMEFSRACDNAINAALNYGYSILLSAFAREIAVAGYITQIGIFHNNVHNQFNLACDFMEPFRPFVDNHIINMSFNKFEHDEKIEVIQILNKTVKIDGQMQYMIPAIRIFTRSLFDALSEDDISKIKLPAYEL